MRRVFLGLREQRQRPGGGRTKQRGAQRVCQNRSEREMSTYRSGTQVPAMEALTAGLAPGTRVSTPYVRFAAFPRRALIAGHCEPNNDVFLSLSLSIHARPKPREHE